MKRLALIVAIGVSLTAASTAWGADTITPMCATAQGTAPCAAGWYTTPVVLTWAWSPSTAGSCTETSYNSDTNTTVSCTVSWPGFTGTAYYTAQVETSSPTAAVAPNRPADSDSWYNHPVPALVSAGSFSGIASCSSTTYSGPNSMSATLFATCVDNAGKTVTVASAPFAYDSTPPSLTAAADPGDQSVALSWQAGADMAPVASIQVTRTGGTKAAGADTVYTGTGTGFKDTHLKNGVHYAYTITALDQAGNVAVQTVDATPGARLLAPALNTRVSRPPMLSWTPVPGATYYNVQLLHHGKVLSVWPTPASLELRRTWRFDGHRYRLKPGKYRWFVWPGFGRRRAGHYGHMIGSGTFVVVR